MNGVESKSPEEIVTAATNAVGSATSVHVAGYVMSSGSRITLDLNLVNGKGGEGSMAQNGLSFQVVAVGNAVYINGTIAFWQRFAGSGAAQLLWGKWIKFPASGQLAALATLTDLQKLFNQLLSDHGQLDKGSITTIRAQRVIPVKDTTNGGTLYVATTGKPYPIEVVKNGPGGGQITFDRFNQPVTLTAPSKAIDISQLQ
ncbi:MAG TPA: hypothetical protein VEF89_32150 [Solirubrobacteraceae bacterium]|nr:hypothetical protein [Solirubrobacteraceae bacterium]